MREQGKDTIGKIFTERFGSGGVRRQRSPDGNDLLKEKKRERKKKRGRRKSRLNQHRRQGASLVGACV
jgi:hypothetical protein